MPIISFWCIVTLFAWQASVLLNGDTRKYLFTSCILPFYVHIQIGKWSLICHRSTSSKFAHTPTHTQSHSFNVMITEQASRRTGLDSYAQVSICYSIRTVGNIVIRYSLWILLLLRASSGCYSILFSLIVSYFIVTWPCFNGVAL